MKIYIIIIINDSKWAEIESICWKSTRQTVHGKIFQLFGFHFFHDILTELAVFTVAVPLTSLLWTQRAELLSTINMFVYKNRHTTYQLPPGILKKVCFSFNNILLDLKNVAVAVTLIIIRDLMFEAWTNFATFCN